MRKGNFKEKENKAKFVRILCGGKFNTVHKGHVYFLRQAKKLGDRLFVVVANDAHNNREYAQPQARRKKAIQVLGIADKVLIGDPKSFVKTVMKVRPDVIALGYDQKLPRDCVSYVKKNKIKVRRIKKLKGYETSNILSEGRIS